MSNEDKPSVKMLGRAGLSYRRGDRALEVDSEMLAGGDFDIVVYRDSIRRWNAPYDGEPISEAERAHIVADIEAALSNLRIDW